MPNYLNQSVLVKNIGGFSFFSSGSTAFESTSSNASTAAQLDINISSSLPTNIINNTTLNPYIRFTVVSGSNTSNGIDQEIIIRFFSSSHIQPKYTSSADTTNPGYVLIPSRSLYITSSNTEEITIIDVPYTNPTSYSVLASSIHNTLTGSSYFIGNSLSASKTSTAKSETVSIHYNNYRGAVGTSPTLYTGSGAIPLTSGISVSYTSTGSGALNFSPQAQLHFASSSYQLRLNTENPNSLELTQGISSSGFVSNTKTESTLLFFSSSGKIGLGTKNPKSDVDFKADSFKIRSTDGKREMQFSDDGRLSTRKFSDSAVSESIGSEIILSYTPGTFLSPKKAQVGETIGTINFVDESFNTSTLEKYFKSGSVAQITSTVRQVTGLGAAGDLQFKVNVDPAAPQEELISFMNIDPFTYGAAVHFPYSVHSEANVSASGNIYGSRIYQNGTQIQTIYSPIAGGTGIETVGALGAGSITSGFTSIDVGSGAITTTGILLGGNITGSNISASGTVTADDLHLPSTSPSTTSNLLYVSSSTAITGSRSANNLMYSGSMIGTGTGIIHIMHGSYKKASAHTTRTYISFGTGDKENTAAGNGYVRYHPPYGGKIRKFTAAGSLGGSKIGVVTFEFYINGSIVSAATCTATVNPQDTMVDIDFNNAAIFDKGDKVQIALTSAAADGTDYWIYWNSVFEFNVD